jgi:hypothetical protein
MGGGIKRRSDENSNAGWRSASRARKKPAKNVGSQTHGDTDIAEGATTVVTDCEVVVRAPLLESIDNTEMDFEV